MHIQKPEVRIIEPQQVNVTTDVDLNNSEAAALLAKYGFREPIKSQQPFNPDSKLTAEELYQKSIREKEEMRQREIQRRNRPNPYGFDPNNVNYSESRYATIEGESFGIQVQIVSDMPIYGNRKF